MSRFAPLILSIAAACFAAPAATETEDGLYGAPVPNDAVFIRRFGNSDGATTAFGRVFSQNELQDGAYTAVSARLLNGVAGGAFYSLVDDGGEPRIIEEPARDDPARVHLFLLNADASDARLVVADGGPEVISAIGAGQISGRAVNPMSVAILVEVDGHAEAFDVVLRRGVNLTFLVADGDVRLVEHRFGPVVAPD